MASDSATPPGFMAQLLAGIEQQGRWRSRRLARQPAQEQDTDDGGQDTRLRAYSPPLSQTLELTSLVACQTDVIPLSRAPASGRAMFQPSAVRSAATARRCPHGDAQQHTPQAVLKMPSHPSRASPNYAELRAWRLPATRFRLPRCIRANRDGEGNGDPPQPESTGSNWKRSRGTSVPRRLRR